MVKKEFTEPIQLASVIAHQLKSPITAVLTMLKTVLGEYSGPLNPKQRELLEKAVARCNDSLSIAQRLLTIANAMEHPQSFHGQVDLADIISKVYLNHQTKASQRHITITVNINAKSTITRGHAASIHEAVEALVQNALKYTPNHGQIEINLSDGEQPGIVCLSIGDSGIGVAPEDKTRIFQPFYRTKAAQKSARPGSGLGLAFVKAVVEAVGGTIRVDRSHLGGAEFIVALHRVEPKPDLQGEQKMSHAFRVIIIGGVAAGPKVAAKIVRLRPDAEVTIIDKGKLLSYAGCGLPFYISGVVRDQAKLMSSPAGELRDLVFFQKVKNVNIMNETEALEIDRLHKVIRIRDRLSLEEQWLEYDKLVLATGATPIIPSIKGIRLNNIFSLHGVNDAEGIKTALEQGRSRDVVIFGGGLLGIEITEALTQKGCRVTIIEKREQILHDLDWEIARLLEHHLESQGVRVLTDTTIEACEGEGVVSSVVTDKGIIPTDLVILAVGITPNTALAKKAGLRIGSTGGIKVDEYMCTSDEDIYAAGDCVESISMLTGKPCYIPFGSVANKQGRVVAINLAGGHDTFPPSLRSVSCSVFDYAVARTGLSESEAISHGYSVTTVLAPGPDRESFVPQVKSLMMKLVVDSKTRRLLGAQAIGTGEAEKRINVAALAITNKMTVDQIANLDLCYTPNFSPVMDNLITAANIARNKLNGDMNSITSRDLYEKINNKEDITLLDIRTYNEFEQERLPNSLHIPLGALRERISEVPHNKPVIIICSIGLRGYEAYLILRNNGYDEARVLDGGLDMWPYEKLQ